jgi:hypothetical protein
VFRQQRRPPLPGRSFPSERLAHARRTQPHPRPIHYGELVQYLETNGYVTRVPHPNDRRAKLVFPTARGHEVIAIAQGLVPELEAKVTTLLGLERTRALRNDLEAIRRTVRSDTTAESWMLNRSGVIDRVARRVTEASTLAAIDDQVIDAAQTKTPKQLQVWLLRLLQSGR